MARAFLLPSLALAATEYDVVWSGRYEDTDGGCGIGRDSQWIAKGACVPHGGKFFMLDSCGDTNLTVKVFTDDACAEPDTPAQVDLTITDTVYAHGVKNTECVTIGADVMLSECVKMSCDDNFTDGVATNCWEITTTTTTNAVECAFMPTGMKNDKGEVVDDKRACYPKADIQCMITDKAMSKEADCKAPCVWYDGPSSCLSKETYDLMVANDENYPAYWKTCFEKKEGDDCPVSGAATPVSGAATRGAAGALIATAAAAIFC